jgi:hypothetical protein
MNPSSWFGPGGDNTLEVLWDDDERVFCRRWRDGADGNRHAVLAVLSLRSTRRLAASIASHANTD